VDVVAAAVEGRPEPRRPAHMRSRLNGFAERPPATPHLQDAHAALAIDDVKLNFFCLAVAIADFSCLCGIRATFAIPDVMVEQSDGEADCLRHRRSHR
jgi:hypothetical protein